MDARNLLPQVTVITVQRQGRDKPSGVTRRRRRRLPAERWKGNPKRCDGHVMMHV